jgi:hypothetical protein
MTKLLRLLPLLSLSLGCAIEKGTADDELASESANAVESFARIDFDASFNETVTGTLRAGGKVEIHYDPARLTTCRGTEGGRPQWGISGSLRLGGATQSFTVAGLMEPANNTVTIALPASGDLELWFVNTSKYGCVAYDSNFGSNYHFKVEANPKQPGWMGNAASAISRETCFDGLACDKSRVPLESGFRFDTWARQRATIAGAYFDVWKEGVTDFANPDLWKQLDVQVHHRQVGAPAWSTAYVSLEKRVGNDARYVVPLRSIDPLGGRTRTSRDDCPKGPLSVSADGMYVETEVEFYFTVNGFELRPNNAFPVYRGTYSDYRDLYKVCF